MRRFSKIISWVMLIVLLMAFLPASVFAEQSDAAYIRVEGFDSTLVEKTALSLKPFDLTEYGISESPKEYTVLHALVEVLDSMGADLNDSAVLNVNGGAYISSILNVTADGNAGWMYVLNDNTSWNSIVEQQLQQNDYVVIYYIDDWMTDSYASFGLEDEIEVDAFSTVKLNLMNHVTDPVTWDVAPMPLSDAVILIDGSETDFVTDSNGDVFITFTKAGEYALSAVKYENGENIISRPSTLVSVKSRGAAVDIYKQDGVFYRSYIDTEAFDLQPYGLESSADGFTALHALILALEDNNIAPTDSDLNNLNGGQYISKLDGLLADGNSGWMYTVNNDSSWYSLNEQAIEDGDLLQVYFIEDWMTDTYAYFDIREIDIDGGNSITLNLYHHVTDPVTWDVASLPASNVEILINGRRAGYSVDKNGQLAIKLNKQGSYYFSIMDGQNLSNSTVQVNVLNTLEVSAQDFSDGGRVSDNYQNYMQRAIDKSIVIGDDKGALRADSVVSKAEFYTMLVRALELDIPGRYNSKYDDIGKNHWFAGIAQSVYDSKLAPSAALFNPNAVLDKDTVVYAFTSAFGSAALTADMEDLFTGGLTREQAVYLILEYMEISTSK